MKSYGSGVYNDIENNYELGDEIRDMILSLSLVVGGLLGMAVTLSSDAGELTNYADTVDRASRDISDGP